MHGRGAAEVLEVHASILIAGELGVASDHRRLAHARDAADPERRTDGALVHRAAAGERGVLLVQREHTATQALVLKRLAQHAGACHRTPVVGEAERALLPSARPSRSAPRRARPRVIAGRKPTGTRASAGGRLAQRAQQRRRVDHRVGVGHRDHRAEATAAAARVPVSRSSLCSWPGVRRCTCGSTKAGSRCLRLALGPARCRRLRSAHPRRRSRRSARHARARRPARRSRCADRARVTPVISRSASALVPCTIAGRPSASLSRRGAVMSGLALTPAVARGGDGMRVRPRAARRGPPCARPRRPRPAR